MMFLLLIIYNFAATAALLWMIVKDPRYMLQDYPPEIIAAVPPRTEEEKKGALLFGTPFLVVLFLFPLVAGWISKCTSDYNFLQIWLRIFFLMFSFNAFDLLIIDWFVFCTLTPKFMVIPGSEGHPAYKDYRFHFIAFLKGTFFSCLGSLFYAGLIEIFSLLIR